MLRRYREKYMSSIYRSVSQSNSTKKYKLGLALSGGGARGIAHVGVLKAFEEAGIVPDAYSGTSAGSIVGAMRAAGKTPEQIMQMVKESSLFKIFKVGMPIDGLTKLTYLREKLSAYIASDSFEDLKKPLFVSLANLNTGQKEIVSSGVLFDVVMASCSIPLVFKPVEINGALYVDGGLFNNLPADALREHCEVLIGINVMPNIEVPAKELQTVIGIASRCFDLSVRANTVNSLEMCDLVIEPEELHQYGIHQFNKYQELYKIGYQAGKSQVDEIKALLARGV